MMRAGLLLMMLAAASCSMKTVVRVSDEPPTFNHPDALIVCPAGSVKRTVAKTFRDLDPVRLADAKAVPPPGYVPPKMLSPPTIRYPAHPFFGNGWVSVFVIVDQQGLAIEPKIVCTTADKFEMAALESVPTMRFSPAMLDGVPVEDAAIIPIDFSLK